MEVSRATTHARKMSSMASPMSKSYKARILLIRRKVALILLVLIIARWQELAVLLDTQMRPGLLGKQVHKNKIRSDITN